MAYTLFFLDSIRNVVLGAGGSGGISDTGNVRMARYFDSRKSFTHSPYLLNVMGLEVISAMTPRVVRTRFT
jgi:hypothetical protein